MTPKKFSRLLWTAVICLGLFCILPDSILGLVALVVTVACLVILLYSLESGKLYASFSLEVGIDEEDKETDETPRKPWVHSGFKGIEIVDGEDGPVCVLADIVHRPPRAPVGSETEAIPTDMVL